MSKKYLIIFQTLLVVLAASGCHLFSGGKDAKDKKRGRNEKAAPAVITESVLEKVIPRSLTVVATLQGIAQVDVYSKFMGRLSYMGPKEGEKVARGALLFRVDRSDPGESFLSAPVESPIAGWVGRWNAANLGEQLSTTQPVVSIVDDTALRTTVYLPLDSWMLLRKDTKVRVKMNNEEREAKIITIARLAEAGSGRGSAEIEIDNQDRSWRAGMVVKVTLDLDPRQRIVISAKGLSITDQGAFVYVVADGKAQRKKVRFEVVDADSVEILEGLKEKDQLIVSGVNQVSDGRPVKIISNESEVSRKR
jgi:multidrug efflux pump subunit AcrA (membrane-fusion protein)